MLALGSDSNAAYVRDLTIGATLLSLPHPRPTLLEPVGVLFDRLYIFTERQGLPTPSFQVTVRDAAGGVVWIETVPAGANP